MTLQLLFAHIFISYVASLHFHVLITLGILDYWVVHLDMDPFVCCKMISVQIVFPK